MNNYNRKFFYNKLFVIIIDLLLLHFSYFLSYYIKFGFDPPKENIYPYYTLIPIITIIFILLFNIYGLYTIERKSSGEIIFSLTIALIILQITTMSLTFLVRNFAFPRTIFFIAFIIQLLFLSIWRHFLQKQFKNFHGNKYGLIIGKPENAELLAKKLIINSKGWYNIKYIINEDKHKSLIDYINDIEMIHICDNIDEEIKTWVIEQAINYKKEVYIIPEFKDILLFRANLVQFEDIPAMSIYYPELTYEQKIIKRSLDIILSILGIIIFCPLMIITAITIKLTSKGPIIYKQTRITECNREFLIYKFRTMYNNAEKLTGPVLASEDDPRITKVGKVLRATRIDELPQLFNVLKGDMSFIGPRPERPYFVNQFEEKIPNYKYRHNVKSGITGLAQVMGKYSTEVSDKLKLDLIYIKNYSILLDFKIILLTIKIAFTKEASSGLKEDITLKDFLKLNNYIVYKETGITKLDNRRQL